MRKLTGLEMLQVYGGGKCHKPAKGAKGKGKGGTHKGSSHKGGTHKGGSGSHKGGSKCTTPTGPTLPE